MIEVTCRWLAKACLSLACALIFALAVIGALDSVLTNTLGRPLPATFELTEVGLALIIFLAQPYIALSSAHIRVELFEIRNSAIRMARTLLVLTLSILSYSVIGAGIWRTMVKSIKFSEQSIGLFSFPIWPFKIAVFVCIGITIFILVCITFTGDDRAKTGLANEGAH